MSIVSFLTLMTLGEGQSVSNSRLAVMAITLLTNVAGTGMLIESFGYRIVLAGTEQRKCLLKPEL